MKLIYVTAKDEKEAKGIAKRLVEEKLIACANIYNLNSVYPWKGKIEEGPESVMILKTKDNLVDKVMKRVKELHSYTIPCMLVIPVEKVNKEYLDWMDSVTK
jgi:periplasmic divalent cation tolerance protein